MSKIDMIDTLLHEADVAHNLLTLFGVPSGPKKQDEDDEDVFYNLSERIHMFAEMYGIEYVSLRGGEDD